MSSGVYLVFLPEHVIDSGEKTRLIQLLPIYISHTVPNPECLLMKGFLLIVLILP